MLFYIKKEGTLRSEGTLHNISFMVHQSTVLSRLLLIWPVLVEKAIVAHRLCFRVLPDSGKLMGCAVQASREHD